MVAAFTGGVDANLAHRPPQAVDGRGRRIVGRAPRVVDDDYVPGRIAAAGDGVVHLGRVVDVRVRANPPPPFWC